MPRPKKRRRVCRLPDYNRYGPLGMKNDNPQIEMSIDEYETIRLIDYERMTQEECASLMNVARTTVQGIYESARIKLAKSLVDGNGLIIQGGHYKVCEDDPCIHRNHRCRRGRWE